MRDETMDQGDAEALLLSRARRGLDPSGADHARIQARLSAGFALLGSRELLQDASGVQGDGPGEDLPSSAKMQGYTLTSLVGTGVASGVLAFVLGVFVGGGGTTEPVPGPPPVRMAQPQPSGALPESAPLAPELDLTNLEAEVAPSEKRTNASPSAPSSARADAPAAPALYDELSHVRRAQAALKQSNPGLALGLMQALDESQPHGALRAERTVTKVLALCQLGRQDEATDLARDLLSKDSDAAVYRQRLAASCANLEPLPAKD